MAEDDPTLLRQIATRLSEPPPAESAVPGQLGSILSETASLHGGRPEAADAAHPEGFDADAAALFEAVVEAAYLVAHADGIFDEAERVAFEEVVLTACGDSIPRRQLAAILADLDAQLNEDGLEKRVRVVARTIATREHAREVLRVAALIAQISEGVSEVEREVMTQLAIECGLGEDAVDQAVSEVEAELGRRR